MQTKQDGRLGTEKSRETDARTGPSLCPRTDCKCTI